MDLILVPKMFLCTQDILNTGVSSSWNEKNGADRLLARLIHES